MKPSVLSRIVAGLLVLRGRAHGSLCAAAAAFALACSSCTGVSGPSGERLDTQVSATHVHVGDSVTVTLRVSNPTFRGLTLIYGSRVTYAQVTQASTTYGSNVTPTGPDTISLASGTHVDLQPVTLLIPPPGVYPPAGAASEEMNLPPGQYNLAACAWVGGDATPEGIGQVPFCAQPVTFTVTL